MADLTSRLEIERPARAVSRWLALLLWLAAGLGEVLVCARTDNAMVLVEAEQFADLGGWGVDQQFMDQMGSPYPLAHVLGVPVRNTTIVAGVRPRPSTMSPTCPPSHFAPLTGIQSRRISMNDNPKGITAR